MNALYRMECAPIRKEYAKTHKRPEGPIDNFKSEMSILEDADRGSVTHQADLANYSKQEAKAREAAGDIRALSSRNTNRGRDNNRQPYNRGRGRGCDVELKPGEIKLSSRNYNSKYQNAEVTFCFLDAVAQG